MDDDSNIQVIVRCRARNPQEVAAKSPNIIDLPDDVVSVSEPYVTINQDHDVSSQNTLTSKTFKVDQVYGSQADQSLIFTNVAQPLFRDFLSGLNVTILAYGQTGTGKTHTMCGDLNSDVDEDDSTNQAGIIPRILHQLFKSLSQKDGDFMVKISCIELYKEELHDLLNDTESAAQSSKLRILTDNSKDNTIIIQNLKEYHINDQNLGLNLLRKCWSKRKVGATRLNDVSSRSHTIFTINLFKKVNNTHFKFSKMNLVDLAGSEDINKSGAVNQRAREAGSINQSLLTLGKVINALSEGKDSKHIPYRDSKLTRLLQDSIGGGTKTSLIATISPAKINMQETLSTLSYASKAKDIKNLPQLSLENELMLKKILVQDLSREIIRLNKDLLATKDKESGGIKMSIDNYNEYLTNFKNFENEIKEKNSEINSLNSKLKERDQETKQLKQMVNEMKANEIKLTEKAEQQTNQINELSSNFVKLNEKYHLQNDQLAKIVNSNLYDINKQIDGVIGNLSLSNSKLSSNITKFKEEFRASIVELKQQLNQQSKLVNEAISGSASDMQKILDENFKHGEVSDFVGANSKAMSHSLSQLRNLTKIFSSYIDTKHLLNTSEHNKKALDAVVKEQLGRNEIMKQNMMKQVIRLIDDTFSENNKTVETSIGVYSQKLLDANKQEISDRKASWMSEVNSNMSNISDGITSATDFAHKYETSQQAKISKTSTQVLNSIAKTVGAVMSKHNDSVMSNQMFGSNESLETVSKTIAETKKHTHMDLQSLSRDLKGFQAAIHESSGFVRSRHNSSSSSSRLSSRSPGRSPSRSPHIRKSPTASPSRSPMRSLKRISQGNTTEEMDALKILGGSLQKSRIPQLFHTADKENYGAKRRRPN